MTIKWVMTDPLVMNGEPFCYGTRLTVRNILELRSNGYTLSRMLKEHPELRRMGVAAAYSFAARNKARYAEFFEPDGSLAGPGYTEAEAEGLPRQYRLPGVVIKPAGSARDVHRGFTFPSRPATRMTPSTSHKGDGTK